MKTDTGNSVQNKPAPANGDEGELGGHEKAVDRHEERDRHQANNQLSRGRGRGVGEWEHGELRG